MRTTAIIVAAGRGTRLGGGVDKAFRPLADQPMLVYSLHTFSSVPEVTSIVVVVAAHEHARTEAILGATGPWPVPIRLAAGGVERQDSVAAGLAVVDADTELVAVHDAARPFVTAECVITCLTIAAETGAAIAAVPATDTVKLTDADGRIVDSPDRRRAWLAQTPQAFRLSVLKDAYCRAREAGRVATDDAALVAATGYPVRVVLGSPDNRKITTPEDLRWADWYARTRVQYTS